jgi:hypothetical protein
LKVLRVEVLKNDWFREKKGNIYGLRGFLVPNGVEWLFEPMETEMTGEGSAFAGPRVGRWRIWRDEETRTFRIANSSARDTNDEFGVTMCIVAEWGYL